MIASPVDADGGSCCPCASGSGCREHAPVGTEIGCRVVPPRDSYPACRNVGQAHRGLSVFSLKIACVCSVRRRPVFSVVRDVAVASKTPSEREKKQLYRHNCTYRLRKTAQASSDRKNVGNGRKGGTGCEDWKRGMPGITHPQCNVIVVCSCVAPQTSSGKLGSPINRV